MLYVGSQIGSGMMFGGIEKRPASTIGRVWRRGPPLFAPRRIDDGLVERRKRRAREDL